MIMKLYWYLTIVDNFAPVKWQAVSRKNKVCNSENGNGKRQIARVKLKLTLHDIKRKILTTQKMKFRERLGQKSKPSGLPLIRPANFSCSLTFQGRDGWFHQYWCQIWHSPLMITDPSLNCYNTICWVKKGTKMPTKMYKSIGPCCKGQSWSPNQA